MLGRVWAMVGAVLVWLNGEHLARWQAAIPTQDLPIEHAEDLGAAEGPGLSGP